MLSLPFFGKKQSAPEVYFGVMVTDTITQGFIFDVTDQNARIITQSSYESTPVYDQVLQAIDTVISDIESTEKVTVNKTIYFLYSSQLDTQTHNIVEPYRSMLKKSAAELALTPLGYIDIHESVAGYLKKRAVLNYLLIEIDQHTLSMFIYKGAQLIWSGKQARTSSISEDMKTVFGGMTDAIMLPTRLFLYGNVDMTAVSTEITSYQWDEKTFSQHPTIEIIKEGTIMQLLADTCAEEMVSGNKGQPPAPRPSTVQTQSIELAQAAGTDFGFVIGKDVGLARTATPRTSTMPLQPSSDVDMQPEPDIAAREKKSISNSLHTIMSRISFPSISLSGSKVIIVVLAILLLLAGGVSAFEYFLHRVTIEVIVPSQIISTSLPLSIPVTEDTKISTLSAIRRVQSKELTESIAVTGQKEVGEKAKGQVTIHNFDNAEKTFEKGTKIQNGSYLFIFDTSVKIASSSGVTADGVKQSGKAKVAVTADAIGPEYNIKSGTQFSIDSLQTSLYVAFADAAFTGGTKKQIATVSNSDVEKLKKKVEAEAAQRGAKDVVALVAKDEILIDELAEALLADTEFSKKVGDEAKEVELKASSDVIFYTLKKQPLEKTILNILAEKQKAGYVIDKQRLKYDLKKASLSEEEDEIEVEVAAEVPQLRSISIEQLQTEFAMKGYSQLPQIASQKSGALDVQVIDQQPALPFVRWTPLFSRSISIRIDTP